jgi:opacity protein-like surface antigen
MGAASCAPLATGLTPGGFSAPSPPFFQTTCHERDDWIATVAAKLGYLWTPRTLLYLKGGAAWDRETWSATCNLGPLNGSLGGGVQACTNPAGALINSISASTTRMGGMIGFGTEFALTPNWSAKAEYDWIGFGNANLTLSDGTVVNTKSSISEAKIGLNYHFNSGAIAARY